MDARRGAGELRAKMSSVLLGKRIPRYLMLDVAHLKGKSRAMQLKREAERLLALLMVVDTEQ